MQNCNTRKTAPETEILCTDVASEFRTIQFYFRLAPFNADLAIGLYIVITTWKQSDML
jgi:hypothetical protein